ncbi:7-carboxy-7-deazaguanine synthase QueE [uncultured Selenomonas sp.]|uniref:7-carboxy-7-deazaguanine synthase QueE n=1 Tax=uncultured Selenomonas sp. TaxID=159275 RepID=UPI0025EEA6E0|nr:7-carboxy-7-deazaguanine synthase QueE [uncultured Selenomonas sp.]
MSKDSENIIEIFSSIQGEGKYVGCRQVFVRFEGCNLHCAYCDTEHAIGAHPACRIETAAGSRMFHELLNPVSAEDAAVQIQALLVEAPAQAVSFTGGEPLLHAPFIHTLRGKVDALTPFLLETNGTLSEPLATVLDDVDIISMDLKLPSATGEALWDAHRRFLTLARRKELYVKMVIAENTPDEEFIRAVSLLESVAPDALLILQPVTPCGGVAACPPERVLAMQAEAMRHVRDARVIPQTHKFIGQL